jgi:hypothetical protein
MPSVVTRFQTGPRTYPAVEAITGGQLVEARVGGVGVAAAGSLVVKGVAKDDASNTGTPLTPTTVAGHPQLAAFVVPTSVAVESGHRTVMGVTYAAAATFGQKLIAAANGQVTPAGATPDARTIVGECDEPAGVASGATGATIIY